MRLWRWCWVVPFLAAHVVPAAAAPNAVKDPMRVVLVREAGSECEPNCREWISAEGQITQETEEQFRKIFRSVGKRKPPILVHSPGGNIDTALKIGRMLRSRGVDVAVGKTWFRDCSPTDKACSAQKSFQGYRGTVIPVRAWCSSACVYLLAGGSRRYIGKWSGLGVHKGQRRITRFVRHYRVQYRIINGRRVEIARRLISTKQTGTSTETIDENDKAHRQIGDYLVEMGVNRKLMDLVLKAEYEGMYWLTDRDISETKIAVQDITLQDVFLPASQARAASASIPVTLPAPAEIKVPLPPEVPAPDYDDFVLANVDEKLTVMGALDGRLARIDIAFGIRADRTDAVIRATFMFDGKPMPQRRVHFAVLLDDGRQVIETAGDPRASEDTPLTLRMSRRDACRIYSGEPAAYALKIWDQGAVIPTNIRFEAQMADLSRYRRLPACEGERSRLLTASAERRLPESIIPPKHHFVQTDRSLLGQAIVAFDSELRPRSRVEVDFLRDPKDPQQVEAEVMVFLNSTKLRSDAEVEFAHEDLGTLTARRQPEAPAFAPLKMRMPLKTFCGWNRGGRMTVAIKVLGAEARIIPRSIPYLVLKNEPPSTLC